MGISHNRFPPTVSKAVMILALGPPLPLLEKVPVIAEAPPQRNPKP